MPNGAFVAYYRVSTTRQGVSGLGLEAQKKAVTDYLNGGNWNIVAEFTEIESGKRNNRTQLQAAISACKKYKAILILAKIDRLSRNLAFIANLMDSGIEFICCDMPSANRLTLHIMAAVAEDEAKRISDRTIAALQAAKARGVKLGKYGAETLSKQNHAKSIQFALSLRDTIDLIKKDGFATVREICNQLNLRQIPTAGGTGRKWHLATVHKLLGHLAQ